MVLNIECGRYHGPHSNLVRSVRVRTITLKPYRTIKKNSAPSVSAMGLLYNNFAIYILYKEKLPIGCAPAFKDLDVFKVEVAAGEKLYIDPSTHETHKQQDI